MSKEKIFGDIKGLKKEKNAIILAHYYQESDIQDIADFVGDSLALAQLALKTSAEIIILCGVHFMAETVKILTPDKRVIVPDIDAGCSLADSCPIEEFKEFLEKHPSYTVISYINTTTEIKALSDIVVTSTNAKAVIDSLPEDEKIIFAPDKNMGCWLNRQTGRNMLLWDGGCHLHEQFSLPGILKLKKENPEALVLAHPECPKDILDIADHVGSTSSILNYATDSEEQQFIVVTECGILHQMRKANPKKKFIAAPSTEYGSVCNKCIYMRKNSLEKLYRCLNYEEPEIFVDEEVIQQSLKSIQRMLDISANLGL